MDPAANGDAITGAPDLAGCVRCPACAAWCRVDLVRPDALGRERCFRCDPGRRQGFGPRALPPVPGRPRPWALVLAGAVLALAGALLGHLIFR